MIRKEFLTAQTIIKLSIFLIVGFGFLFFANSTFAQTTVTFGESGFETYNNTNTDTYINSGTATTNYGSAANISIMSNTWRGLLKFDLSQIPSNATIDSATLNLYLNSVFGVPGNITFYRLLKNWVESAATWNVYDSINSWSTPGAGSGTDYDSTAVLIQDPSVALGTKTFNIPVSQIQNWVNGSQPNYGLLLTLSGGSIYYFFSSSENSTASQRPKLTVTYTVAGGDTTPPVLSSGSPSGTLFSGTTQTALSVSTNENATCRYSTASGISYSSMTNTFSTTGSINHSTTVSNLSDGQSYNYYVRCQDRAATPNANTSDYPISFSVASATLEVGAGRTYSTIQEAVNISVAGDTVLVYPGTYNESVYIPDGRAGTPTAPITIKAQYPARKPLDGGAWADTADKRSVVNAGSGVAGFYNDDYGTPYVSNIIIDGFYITGGGGLSAYNSGGGIFFENDNNIWIRNNVILNNNPYRALNSNGEQVGNVYLKFTSNSLVQNNYLEYSYVEPYITSAFLILNSGSYNIAEYNEGYIGPGAVNGSFAYVSVGSSIGFIFRYNYYHRETGISINTMLSRFRDHINTTITNNYFRSTAALPPLYVHENTDAGLIENHKLNRNTFYSEQGVIDDRNNFGLGYLNQTEAIGNIFYSGTMETLSYGIGRAWLTPSYAINVDSNVYYNYPALVDPLLNGYTEINTVNTNPDINPNTGCAASVNNDTYGANLDVGNVPYRKCDGTFYAANGKFGINVVVSDGGADTTPPSAPTGLVVQ